MSYLDKKKSDINIETYLCIVLHVIFMNCAQNAMIDVPFESFYQIKVNSDFWFSVFGTENGQGEVCYRLKCLDNRYITLKSRGYLEYNKQTGRLESFVCINTLIE